MRLIWMVIVVFYSLNASAAQPWWVDAKEAVELAPTALVLDTRGAPAFGMGHPEGAIRVTWQQFSRTEKDHRGELLPAAALQTELRRVGVRAEQTVLVLADPEAWGEDGRIVWMLRAAGHTRAFAVDGGYPAWKRAGGPTRMGASAAVARGDFVVAMRDELVATPGEVRALIGTTAQLVDTREAREFKGATPYGESRGGHVPGAVHLHFRELMTPDGRVRPREEVLSVLAQRGIDPSKPLVPYCTGGIRSGWMTMVLRGYGLDAANYAGSMWQWASLPAAEFPLE